MKSQTSIKIKVLSKRLLCEWSRSKRTRLARKGNVSSNCRIFEIDILVEVYFFVSVILVRGSIYTYRFKFFQFFQVYKNMVHFSSTNCPGPCGSFGTDIDSSSQCVTLLGVIALCRSTLIGINCALLWVGGPPMSTISPAFVTLCCYWNGLSTLQVWVFEGVVFLIILITGIL